MVNLLTWSGATMRNLIKSILLVGILAAIGTVYAAPVSEDVDGNIEIVGAEVDAQTYLDEFKKANPKTYKYCELKTSMVASFYDKRAQGVPQKEIVEVLSGGEGPKPPTYIYIDFLRVVNDIYRKDGQGHYVHPGDHDSVSQFMATEFLNCLEQDY